MFRRRSYALIILFMRFQMRLSTLLLATVVLSYSASPQYSASQTELPHVVLTKLFPPVYSHVAQEALIAGDVKLEVTVHPDGSIESVSSISGHPMLAQAALDSAKQSRFECRACGATNASLYLTFSFRPSQEMDPDPCCCSRDPANPHYHASPISTASQTTEDHITVIGQPGCMCPDACTQKWADEQSRFRSGKCLYLWKCGHRIIYIY
jgi:TonB family protein